jgi:hypothetical protein
MWQKALSNFPLFFCMCPLDFGCFFPTARTCPHASYGHICTDIATTSNKYPIISKLSNFMPNVVLRFACRGLWFQWTYAPSMHATQVQWLSWMWICTMSLTANHSSWYVCISSHSDYCKTFMMQKIGMFVQFHVAHMVCGHPSRTRLE